jgi:hypothetical protein
MRFHTLAAGLVALLAIAPAFPGSTAQSLGVQTPTPMVVIAHIDGGANVYHKVFRDDSPLAQQNPCTYIPGYPCDAIALHLTFDDTKTVDQLYALDAAEWAKVQPSNAQEKHLYWIPGTKVIGAITFGSGGSDCPFVQEVTGLPIPEIPPTTTLQSTACPDRPILDDYGHGTMTATRMGGNEGSLCPTCRVVIIEGLGGIGVRWAAEQGWIDVQTNSWLSLVPPPVDQIESSGTHPLVQFGQHSDPNATTHAFAYAQDKMLVYAASGNGAAYFSGFAPTPTEILSTAAPGVILVGAHDNGHVAPWGGAPAHVVADGYGGLHASKDDTVSMNTNPYACCTSAASPYAAGGGAAVVLAARQILGDHGVGLRTMPNGDKAIAVGPNAPASGILAKGYLTLDEAKTLIKHTAEARPSEGDPNDGTLHWLGAGRDPTTDPYVAAWGPGANPYCQGCITLPVKWSDVPDSVPAYVSIGYGAINPTSVALATQVLQGTATMPDRADVDQFFAVDGLVRGITFTGA